MDKQISVNLSLNAAYLFLKGLKKLPFEEVESLIKDFSAVVEKSLQSSETPVVEEERKD